MMTGNEIIEALECCTTNGASCKGCPAFVKVDRSNCKKYFRGALDIINRQKAEIERLQETICMLTKTGRFYSTVRAEAVKEFAERLKDKSKKRTQDVYGERVFFGDIDNLVKEMAGEDKVQWSKQGECPITAEQFNAIYDDEEMVGDV